MSDKFQKEPQDSKRRKGSRRLLLSVVDLHASRRELGEHRKTRLSVRLVKKGKVTAVEAAEKPPESSQEKVRTAEGGSVETDIRKFVVRLFLLTECSSHLLDVQEKPMTKRKTTLELLLMERRREPPRPSIQDPPPTFEKRAVPC